MLVNHPHLINDVQAAVIVTELTLAAARDTIRILAWLRSNAPETQVLLVANKVQPGTQLEITRKDFETSIERKIDYVIPFDQKLAAQAAKLGKPFAEAGKTSKTVAPLADLVTKLCVISAEGETAKGAGKGRKGGKGTSLIGKFADLKGLMPKKPAKN